MCNSKECIVVLSYSLTCAGPSVIIQSVSILAVTVKAIKYAGTFMLTAMISK